VATSWNSEDWFWKRTIMYSAAAALVVAGGGAYYYFKVMKKGAETAAKPFRLSPRRLRKSITHCRMRGRLPLRHFPR